MAQGGSEAPVFGRLVPFSEAFPEIESAHFRYTEWPVDGGDDGVRAHSSPGEFIRCGNPRCRNEWGSGLPAGEILREMLKSRRVEFATLATCRGVERGRARKLCLRRFRGIRVNIRYRESE